MLISKLKAFAEKFPNQAAFIDSSGQMSWLSLYGKVTSFRASLQAYEGHRVLLIIDGGYSEQVALMIATSEIKAEFIFVSSFHSVENTKNLMHEFEADYILALQDSLIKILFKNHLQISTSISEPFLGILTSGTTGKPKCARYSWDRISKGVAINPKFEGRRWMMSYHIATFAGLQVFLQCFCNGGSLVLSKSLRSSINDDIYMIISNEVNYLNCTPTYCRKLVMNWPDDQSSSIKNITLGGEIVDQQLINSLKKKFSNSRLTHIFASTEMGARIEVRDELEGFPLSFINNEDIRIHEGEIQFRPTDRSMLTYLHLLKNSRSNAMTKEQGWVCSGDLVEVRNDRVYFMGRKDLMINVGGFKVNPSLVEAEIREVAGVQDVVVYGAKNPVSGQIVTAKIIPALGAQTTMLKSLVLKLCKEKLPYYAVPRIFEFTDVIETTASSKLKRVA